MIIIGDTTTQAEIVQAAHALLGLIQQSNTPPPHEPAPVYTTGTDAGGTDADSAYSSYFGDRVRIFGAS